MYVEDTIAAISTPPGEGGIAVIRVCGPEALAVANGVFFPKSGEKLADIAGYTARYGEFRRGGLIDTGVALVYHAPKSYTGEDTAELMCHGGETVAAEVLRAVIDCGARPAAGGEFTKRAYLNGKMTLTEAEAVIDIIEAGSRNGVSAAAQAANGALGRETLRIKGFLTDALAHIAAWLDYPEEDVEPVDQAGLLNKLESAAAAIDSLVGGYELGAAALRGVPVAIAGTPNVGKSTLLNLLSGCESAIVTPVAGTTRDVVEQRVRLGETSVILSDTAGIRDTADEVESIGVERAKQRIDSAALVLAVFDASRPLSSDDRAVIDRLRGKKAIAVINKNDLAAAADCAAIEREFSKTVYISAVADSAGALAAIDRAVAQQLGLDRFSASAPMLANERQRAAAVKAGGYAKEAIKAVGAGVTLDVIADTISEAVGALCELYGENPADEVIDRVFSNFCVGK